MDQFSNFQGLLTKPLPPIILGNTTINNNITATWSTYAKLSL